MHIYGLTGGAGSGKSEAVHHFAELGLPVIDADKLGHEILKPGGPAVSPLLEAFGPEILAPDGGVDRAKLADRVFGDPDAVRRLNAITHPLIIQSIGERLAVLAQEERSMAIVEAAVMAENGKRDPWLTALILVSCREELRIRRLVERRGMDPDAARRRVQSQVPPENKIPIADWVIENEGSLEDLDARVDEVAREIKKREAKP